MTDLNTLVSGSNLFLVWALDINSRGQIVGLDFDNNTQQVHAFLATPCGEKNGNDEGCVDDAVGKITMSVNRNLVLPENIRRRIREQMGRYFIHKLSPR